MVGTLLIWQGTPMTFDSALKATTVEGEEQTIARGPVAAEVAVKATEAPRRWWLLWTKLEPPLRKPDAGCKPD